MCLRVTGVSLELHRRYGVSKASTSICTIPSTASYAAAIVRRYGLSVFRLRAHLLSVDTDCPPQVIGLMLIEYFREPSQQQIKPSCIHYRVKGIHTLRTRMADCHRWVLRKVNKEAEAGMRREQ